MPNSVLLIDDHALFRNALVNLVTLINPTAKIFEASDGNEGIEILDRNVIDLVLLDVQMPNKGGVETLRHIRSSRMTSKVMMLTQFDDNALIVYLLQLGANGFLHKSANTTEFINAVNKIMAEGHYYSDQTMHAIKENLTNTTKVSNLNISAREFQVMTLLKDGKSNKEIAVVLGLTVRTIESYRKGLIKKTHCRNTAELIGLAYRTGIMTT